MKQAEPTEALAATADEAAATADETIDAILAMTGRESTPLRHAFVQQGTPHAPEPGPLRAFVVNGDRRALLLYALALAKTSAEPWDTALPAPVWARALGIGQLETAAAAVAMSRAWGRLEDRNLVRRGRSGRNARIHMLKEDGSGNRYEHPGLLGDRYLQVPDAFWRAGPGDERWYRVLTLPEIAMLLIALSLRDEFRLPSESAPDWYGISADTASHGLGGLAGRGLLKVVKRFWTTPLSPVGYTVQNVYTLQDPFGPR